MSAPEVQRLCRLLVDRACALSGFGSGRLLLRDQSTGDVADASGRAPAQVLPLANGLIAGLVESSHPVLVLPVERTGVTAASIALVAIRHPATADLMGVFVFDDLNDIAVDSTLRTQLAAFADIAGAALSASRDRSGAIARLDALGHRHQSLAYSATVEQRLGQLVGSGGGMAALVRTCAELTGKVVALFGSRHRLVTMAGQPTSGPVRIPCLDDVLAALDPGEGASAWPVLVPARPGSGLSHRHLLMPVVRRGEDFGRLLVVEYPTTLSAADEVVARCAAAHIGTEFVIQRRVAKVAWNARAALTRQLIRGTSDVEDLRDSGEYLGVDVHARRVLAYVVGAGTADDVVDERLAVEVERRLGVDVLVTRGSAATVLLVEAPSQIASAEMVSRVKGALAAAAAVLFPGGDLIAGVSSACDPAGLVRAYRQAREVASCIDRLAPAAITRVLAVDDLGPARLFIANSDTASLRGYVDDVLGPLLTGLPGSADLLLTLQCFVEAGRSVRVAAAQLGLHENTIRLRLARVHAIAGLDVLGDPTSQLSLQTALLVLRLQGHPAVPSFDVSGGHQARHTA